MHVQGLLIYSRYLWFTAFLCLLLQRKIWYQWMGYIWSRKRVSKTGKSEIHCISSIGTTVTMYLWYLRLSRPHICPLLILIDFLDNFCYLFLFFVMWYRHYTILCFLTECTQWVLANHKNQWKIWAVWYLSCSGMTYTCLFCNVFFFSGENQAQNFQMIWMIK